MRTFRRSARTQVPVLIICACKGVPEAVAGSFGIGASKDGVLLEWQAQETALAPAIVASSLQQRAFHLTVLQTGMDCWGHCEGMSGYCSWCGEGNACCKQGFDGDPAECKRALGFTTNHHECVALAVDQPGKDCWGKCIEGKSGFCSWCGKGNACCKKGFPGDPSECSRAVGFTTEHHECVKLHSAPSPQPQTQTTETQHVASPSPAPQPVAPPSPVPQPAPVAQGQVGAALEIPAAPSSVREGFFRQPVIHKGEDCWGKCETGNSGYCKWCGDGNACCKLGFQGDPVECQRAVGFTSEHHECVRLALAPFQGKLDVMPMSALWVLPFAWGSACIAACLLFRRRRSSPAVEPKPLEGDVDLQWRRRSRDDAALRAELKAKANKLNWLGFHV